MADFNITVLNAEPEQFPEGSKDALCSASMALNAAVHLYEDETVNPKILGVLQLVEATLSKLVGDKVAMDEAAERKDAA